VSKREGMVNSSGDEILIALLSVGWERGMAALWGEREGWAVMHIGVTINIDSFDIYLRKEARYGA